MANAFAESMIRLVRPAAKQVLLTWERLESGISFDLTSSKVRANPYEVYERLRSEDPIHRMRLINAWALTGYDFRTTDVFPPERTSWNTRLTGRCWTLILLITRG